MNTVGTFCNEQGDCAPSRCDSSPCFASLLLLNSLLHSSRFSLSFPSYYVTPASVTGNRKSLALFGVCEVLLMIAAETAGSKQQDPVSEIA